MWAKAALLLWSCKFPLCSVGWVGCPDSGPSPSASSPPSRTTSLPVSRPVRRGQGGQGDPPPVLVDHVRRSPSCHGLLGAGGGSNPSAFISLRGKVVEKHPGSSLGVGEGLQSACTASPSLMVCPALRLLSTVVVCRSKIIFTKQI